MYMGSSHYPLSNSLSAALLVVSCCSPTPTIKWMKMGDMLPSRTKMYKFEKLLTITDIEASDQGKYMCIASNSAGEAAHYFDVIVEGGSDIST